MSINKVILIGNVTKDPEIRSMDNGNEVANFSLATTDYWKDKQGEKKEKTEWHNIVVFGNLVSVVKNYVHKGSKLYLEGQLQTRSWDVIGTTKYKTEIVLQGYNSTLQLLDSKGMVKPTAEKKEEKYVSQEKLDEEGFDDRIPF